MIDAQLPKTAVVVEDDPDVRHLLAEVLESAGFSTISVGNGIDGVRAVINYQPLITTLDVNMPGIDGFEAARRIRAQSDTYIIMLTALNEEADVVLGLSAGADEYLNKPFRPRELRARIEALLRRPRGASAVSQPRQEQSGPSFPAYGHPQPVGHPTEQPEPAYQSVPAYQAAPEPGRQPVYAQPAPGYQATPAAAPGVPSATDQDTVVADGNATVAASDEAWVSHRDLQLNPETRIVLVQEHEVDLTRTEFDLLSALMESKRRVRSKADLTLVLRGESYVTSYFVGDADKRAVEAHMTNLRRKLGDSAAQPRYIETVRGVGYRLTSALAA
ncbi:response regulator [Microbacterium sp.]|uniref:response regulator transcription factor n=1 Tax=Microbacterium sp. TaxID=51671 RepID=UPI003F9AACA3